MHGFCQLQDPEEAAAWVQYLSLSSHVSSANTSEMRLPCEKLSGSPTGDFPFPGSQCQPSRHHRQPGCQVMPRMASRCLPGADHCSQGSRNRNKCPAQVAKRQERRRAQTASTPVRHKRNHSFDAFYQPLGHQITTTSECNRHVPTSLCSSGLDLAQDQASGHWLQSEACGTLQGEWNQHCIR